MKRTNDGFSHIRFRRYLKIGRCFKLIDGYPILSDFSMMLVLRWGIPGEMDVCGVKSYPTSVRWSATWICIKLIVYRVSFKLFEYSILLVGSVCARMMSLGGPAPTLVYAATTHSYNV